MGKLITIKEACDLLRRSYPTVIRLLHTQKITGIKVGGVWFFTEDAIQEYIDSRTIKAKKHRAA